MAIQKKGGNCCEKSDSNNSNFSLAWFNIGRSVKNTSKEKEAVVIKPYEEILYTKENINDTISRIDFPLIDLYFDEENEWLLVECQHSLGDEKYRIVADAHILNWNKEFLSVSTFPTGRGTTPIGFLDIYKNGKRYKRVEYGSDGVSIYSEELAKAFEPIAKEELSKLVDEVPEF